ncbi:MAG: GAF domain-containing protein, partial [Acidobacteria bacterium]|nr:GAF domain-containing protein [Acidobacteriota bacterium]
MRVVTSTWNRIRQLPVFLPGRRPILLVRLALLLAIGAALHAGSVAPEHRRIVWPVLGAFLVSWFGSLLLPRAAMEGSRFRVPFLLADTFLLAFLLSLSGPDAPRSFLFFFLMVLIIALGDGLFRILLGAACLSGVFFLGSLPWGSGPAAAMALPSPFLVPLFGVAALYYSYFVAEARHRESLADRVLRERQELRAILDILDATTSTLDFHAVMHTTTARMAELMNAARVSIVLVDREREECTVLVSSDDRSLNRLPIPLAKYPEIRRALETRAPVIIQDVARSPMMAAVREDLLRLGFHSLLVIPLRYGEEIFGTICLRASRRQEGFAPDEVRFAQIVASAAANAVKNSLLYSRAQGEARRHRERSAHLQLLFDHMPDLIFFLDGDWRIAEVNRSVPDRIAVPREELLLREFREWCPKAASLPEKTRSLPRGEFHPCGEVELGRRDGPPLAVRLGVIPLAGDRGFLALAQDISSEKRTQIELQHADRLSAVGELVATVAHELRSRLTGVLGFSQLLAIRNRDPDLARDLERISAAAEQCKTIVNDLLSFSRKTEPDRKVLGVNGILRKALDLLERQMEDSGIRVGLDLAEDL